MLLCLSTRRIHVWMHIFWGLTQICRQHTLLVFFLQLMLTGAIRTNTTWNKWRHIIAHYLIRFEFFPHPPPYIRHNKSCCCSTATTVANKKHIFSLDCCHMICVNELTELGRQLKRVEATFILSKIYCFWNTTNIPQKHYDQMTISFMHEKYTDTTVICNNKFYSVFLFSSSSSVNCSWPILGKCVDETIWIHLITENQLLFHRFENEKRINKFKMDNWNICNKE